MPWEKKRTLAILGPISLWKKGKVSTLENWLQRYQKGTMTPLGQRLRMQLLKGTLTVLRIHSLATPTATLHPHTFPHCWNIRRLTIIWQSYIIWSYMILHWYTTFKYNLWDLGRTGITLLYKFRKQTQRSKKKKVPKVLQLKGRRLQVLQLLIQSPFLIGNSYNKQYSLITSTNLLNTNSGPGTTTDRWYK